MLMPASLCYFCHLPASVQPSTAAAKNLGSSWRSSVRSRMLHWRIVSQFSEYPPLPPPPSSPRALSPEFHPLIEQLYRQTKVAAHGCAERCALCRPPATRTPSSLRSVSRSTSKRSWSSRGRESRQRTGSRNSQPACKKWILSSWVKCLSDKRFVPGFYWSCCDATSESPCSSTCGGKSCLRVASDQTMNHDCWAKDMNHSVNTKYEMCIVN